MLSISLQLLAAGALWSAGSGTESLSVCSGGLSRNVVRSGELAFRHRAATVREVLGELSKVTGVSLFASATVREDILAVAVHNVSLLELRESIAEALNAEWEDLGDGFRLTRTASKIAELQAKHFRLRAELFQKAQLAAKKELDQVPISVDLLVAQLKDRVRQVVERVARGESREEVERAVDPFGPAWPGGRLAREIAATLPAEELAKQSWIRRYFSFEPTRFELMLPGAMVHATRNFAELTNRLRAVFRGVPLPAELSGRANQEFLFSDRSIPDGALRLVVEVRQERHWPSAQVSFWLGDKKGLVLCSSQFDLDPCASAPIPASAFGPEKSLRIPIRLSQMSSQLIAQMRMASSGPVRLQEPPEPLRSMLLQPEQHDVCALVATDVVFAASESLGLNVVLAPTPRLGFQITGPFIEGQATLGKVLAALEDPRLGMSVSRRAGWLIYSPLDPYQTLTDRLPTDTFGPSLRSTARAHAATIGQCVLLVRSFKGLLWNSQLTDTVLYALPQCEMPFGQCDSVLRLLSTLTPAQHNALLSDEGLPFKDLQGRPREIVEETVFSEDVQLLSATALNQEFDPVLYPVTDFKDFAVEKLPFGIDSNARLRLKEFDVTRVRVRGQSGSYSFSRSLSVSEIAQYVADRERRSGDRSDKGLQYKEFAAQTQRVVSLIVQASSDEVYVAQVREKRPQTEWVDSIDSLPAALREQIAAKLRERRPPK